VTAAVKENYNHSNIEYENSASDSTSGTPQASLPEAAKCYDDVDKKRWNSALLNCTIAAQKGDASSQISLGWMYENGKVVAKDNVEAVNWYRKAADQGAPVGQKNLGLMYENGRGVEKDLGEAVNWYRKAADQGDSDGQVALGNMYEYGQGVDKNISKALSLYRQSAEKDNSFGQYNLGTMFEYGAGVEKDLGEALKWYSKAADQGNEYAKKRLAELRAAQKTSTTIPVQFQGEWNDKPAACGTDLSDSRLRIYSDRLQFYESSAYVKSLEIINPQTIKLKLSFTGEGSNWNDSRTLILSGSGQDLKVGDFWRIKC